MTILAVRHEKHEGLGLLEKFFKQEKVPYRYLDVFEDPIQNVDLAAASGIVVLGGSMGVYETAKFPFLSREIEILKEALERQVPTLGICLGSQLLAAAGGTRVFKGPKGKEVGWYPVRMRSGASEDPLLKHCPAEPMVFHWHGDTFELPEGASLLASSEKYPHQAIRLGKKAWGLQFHIVMTESMIHD